MYYDKNGNEVSVAQIKSAIDAGVARLCHSNGNGKTLTAVALDGADYDTRGQCASVWDEAWTTVPRSAAQAMRFARG